LRHASVAVIALLLAGCTASSGPSPAPGPAPAHAATPPGPTPEPAPGPTPDPAPSPAPPAATLSLVTAPVPSACGTPVVDGVLSPGEWDSAVSARFGVVVPDSAGGGEIPATLQIMSDDVNLYVAIRFDLSTAQFSQSFSVELDASGDGMMSQGDDGFGFGRWEEYPWGGGGETSFDDFYRWNCFADGHPAVCAPSDTAVLDGFPPPGTVDGGGAIGFDATSTTVELWHPYRGGDPRDVFAAPGDDLGINFSVRLLDCNEWPRCFGDTSYPPYYRFRSIIIGCGPPPGESIVTVRIDVKPGDLMPTISLSSGGTTPVAVLGAADFDAGAVDPAATYFAGAPVARGPDGAAQASLSDVNGDGWMDMVLHFETAALALEVGAIEATIAGTTLDGRAFRGTDVVRVIP
jgi:hypothetical protein